MARDDISNYLIHWTRGDSYEEAFDILRNIVFEMRIIGSNKYIKGNYNCVCFTEAPVDKFHQVIGKYKPFGIRVSKKWLYGQGGRPVIYESEAEYNLLLDDIKWRHVRYEPTSSSPIDFTWEREWRIKIDELFLPPEEVILILPGEDWARRLEQEHFSREDERIYMESIAYGDWLAYQSPDQFHYAYSIINI